MSLVYLTFHDENIYDTEKNYSQTTHKVERYVSKFKPRVSVEFKIPDVILREDGVKVLTGSVRSAHKTMGNADIRLNPPCNFLRKNQGIKWARLNEHVCQKINRMPPVPKFERAERAEGAEGTKSPKPAEPIETPKLEDDDSKKSLPFNPNCPHPIYFRNHKHRANFVKLNKENTKKLETKRPPPRYIDTIHGDRHNLINTGLIPQYVCSKNFGKVPCYVKDRNKWLNDVRAKCYGEQKEKKDFCMDYVIPKVRMLPREERQEIVKGLKKNYTEVMKNYQRMPLCIDTMAKKLRKVYLENSLTSLEKDIALMESKQDIFIAEN